MKHLYLVTLMCVFGLFTGLTIYDLGDRPVQIREVKVYPTLHFSDRYELIKGSTYISSDNHGTYWQGAYYDKCTGKVWVYDQNGGTWHTNEAVSN